ncbi:MAG: CRTAC1 family protein [Acidobacteriota bacterium]
MSSSLPFVLSAGLWLCMPVLATARTDSPFELVDITSEAGIDFRHVTGASGRKYMVETMGAGAVFFDYDGDLDPDLYLVNGGVLRGFGASEPVTGALYRNDGGLRFTDVTAASGLTHQGYGMGAASGDYDHDGDVELYVTHFGPNRLFRNNGDGTFTEVTAEAGVGNELWSASATWSDLDGDGHLDLYVTNYVDWGYNNHPDCSQRRGGEVLRSYCLPDAFRGLPDALYRNRGDGTFTDVSRDAEVARPDGKGLGVVAFDYNGDDLPDLYVANDTVPNFLFRNEGGMRFTEIALEAGAAYDEEGNALAGMGVGVGDYDLDGDLDLFVTNFSGEANTLYRNEANGFFTDVSFRAGIGRPSLRSLGFGTAFCDLDNDSLLDLVVANGHVLDNTALLREGTSYPQANQFLRNVGDARFEPVRGEGPAFETVKVSRGMAVADLEGDGDSDLLFTNSGERPNLLRNDGGTGNVLRLLMVGRRANRSAVGARLFVNIGDGELAFEVPSASSYLSQNEPVVHLGLGERTEVKALRVRWPQSQEQILGPLAAGKFYVVVEDVGVVRSHPLR